MKGKLQSLGSVKRAVRALQSRKKKVVFTNGCFDIIHHGHVSYLAKARSLGDCLVIGLNTDASVRALKGAGRPLVPQRDRASVLAALSAVDYIVLFDDATPQRLIGEIRPDVLVKGADYRIEEIVGNDIVKSYGGTVKRIRMEKGRSTTDLIKKIVRAYGKQYH
ncbi:MAG TPA: D-glycero-beta-D-manno-heptose 1-phosphate adenylyltransferase [bacterium]|nr:D-glycero-beta-D-manno-heptose 1-phosphate adenylyltransferase [bacterium]